MYKKGKDAKIKEIENLEGLPSMIIYKTDKIQTIEAFGFLNGVIIGDTPISLKKPEGFEGW